MLLLSIVAQSAGGEVEGDESLPQELERLLWEAASDGPRARALRAALSLKRLWQDDADALCHVTALVASIGHVDVAASVCRQALRAQPREACAIFCSMHFALWNCDFDALDALRARAVAALEVAVASHTNAPAAIGHLEALLVLPEHLCALHLLQQTHYLRTESGAVDAFFPPPSPDFIASALFGAQIYGSAGAARGNGQGMLSLAVLTSTARQHAHGYALLAAMRGFRQQPRVHVTCFDTSPHVKPEYDEVRVELQRLCHVWVHHGGSSALHVAQAINSGGYLVTLEVDGWASPQVGNVGPFSCLGPFSTMHKHHLELF